MKKTDKQKKNQRNIIIIVIAVIAIGVLPFICCVGAGFFSAMMESTYESGFVEPIAVQEELVEETKVITSSVSSEVTIDDVTWTILEAKDKGDTLKYIYADEYIYIDVSDYDCISEAGKYIYLKINVVNNSTSPISIYNSSLYNSEGEEFWVTSDTSLCVENNIAYYETINPGVELTFEAVYEVTVEDSGFKYILKDQGYSDSEVVFELGLDN